MITTRGAAPNQFGQLPTRRVVLLGASNLTRAIATVVESTCRLWGRPLDVLAAYGHGRSYGLRKRLLWRELPGIAECGLWQALSGRPPASTAALLTDVGNDLLYDASVPEIACWIETCLERLLRAGARVVMTPLPLASVARLSPARFLFFRSLLFPGCRLTYATLVDRAQALDRRLRTIARRRAIVLAEHRSEWYGFDPIHIKSRHFLKAWGEILSAWSDGSQPGPAARASLRSWFQLRLAAPERRWLFGCEQRQVQPVKRLLDGTTVSLY